MNTWALLCIWTVLIGGTVSDDGSIQIPVEHSFGDIGFKERGYVRITKLPGGDQLAEYVHGKWTPYDHGMLMESVKKGALYKIRAPIRFGTDSITGDNFVMSSTPACSMVHSGLTDNIHLSIDATRQRVLSISDFPLSARDQDCQSSFDETVVDEFNTTVRLVDSVDGPIPETQAYLQKIEREKQERQRGEQGDNRSFLSKYWMYIVPVVIVLMLSSAMNPEAQGAGGGGR